MKNFEEEVEEFLGKYEEGGWCSVKIDRSYYPNTSGGGGTLMNHIIFSKEAPPSEHASFWRWHQVESTPYS